MNEVRPAVTEEEKPEEFRLIYAGQRCNQEGKIFYAYLQEEGSYQELHFSKLRVGAIGGIYVVQGVTKEDGVFSVYPDSIRFSGESIADKERIAFWAALDQQARAQQALIRKERSLAKSDELERAIEPLLRLMQKARTHNEREALVQVVASRMRKGS